MAFAYINPLGNLWKNAGLKYILQPASNVAGEVRKDLWTGREHPPQESGKTRPQGVTARVLPKRPAPEAAAKQVAAPVSRKMDHWKPTPLEDWPVVWQARLGKTKRGRFVWTYEDLANDLLAGQTSGSNAAQTDQQARQQRSVFLRKLIKDLGFPAGTHTFWPVAMPEVEGGEPVPNARLFWSGAYFLGCRGAVLFGSPPARAVLETDNLKPLTHMRINGFLAWVLWDVNVLIANPALYGRILVFLRQSLSPLVGS